MPGTPTTIHGIPTMAGGDAINQIDEWTVAAGAAIDGKLAPSTQGLLSARPTAGKIGQTYKATDTGQYFRDNGTTWDEIVFAGTTPPAVGVPAHQAWQTVALSAGSTVFTPANLSYMKDSLGFVHFRGDIFTITTAAISAGATLCTLPAGYRPGVTERRSLAAYQTSDFTMPRHIDITTAGVVSLSNLQSISAAAGTQFSFGLCGFLAEN